DSQVRDASLRRIDGVPGRLRDRPPDVQQWALPVQLATGVAPEGLAVEERHDRLAFERHVSFQVGREDGGEVPCERFPGRRVDPHLDELRELLDLLVEVLVHLAFDLAKKECSLEQESRRQRSGEEEDVPAQDPGPGGWNSPSSISRRGGPPCPGCRPNRW